MFQKQCGKMYKNEGNILKTYKITVNNTYHLKNEGVCEFFENNGIVNFLKQLFVCRMNIGKRGLFGGFNSSTVVLDKKTVLWYDIIS